MWRVHQSNWQRDFFLTGTSRSQRFCISNVTYVAHLTQSRTHFPRATGLGHSRSSASKKALFPLCRISSHSSRSGRKVVARKVERLPKPSVKGRREVLYLIKSTRRLNHNAWITLPESQCLNHNAWIKFRMTIPDWCRCPSTYNIPLSCDLFIICQLGLPLSRIRETLVHRHRTWAACRVTA